MVCSNNTVLPVHVHSRTASVHCTQYLQLIIGYSPRGVLFSRTYVHTFTTIIMIIHFIDCGNAVTAPERQAGSCVASVTRSLKPPQPFFSPTRTVFAGPKDMPVASTAMPKTYKNS